MANDMKLTPKQSELLKVLQKEKKPRNTTQMDRLLAKVENFSQRTVNSLLSKKLIDFSFPRGFTLTELGKTTKI